jgi:hypothetical protein
MRRATQQKRNRITQCWPQKIFYLSTNLNVFVAVLEALLLEVTVTVTVPTSAVILFTVMLTGVVVLSKV